MAIGQKAGQKLLASKQAQHKSWIFYGKNKTKTALENFNWLLTQSIRSSNRPCTLKKSPEICNSQSWRREVCFVHSAFSKDAVDLPTNRHISPWNWPADIFGQGLLSDSFAVERGVSQHGISWGHRQFLALSPCFGETCAGEHARATQAGVLCHAPRVHFGTNSLHSGSENAHQQR